MPATSTCRDGGEMVTFLIMLAAVMVGLLVQLVVLMVRGLVWATVQIWLLLTRQTGRPYGPAVPPSDGHHDQPFGPPPQRSHHERRF